MATLAMLYQETYSFSSTHLNLLVVFIGLVAVSMVLQAIVVVALAIRTHGTLRDLKESAEEFKARLLPLIDTATDIGYATQDLVHKTAPKIRTITDNLLKTSETLVDASAVVRNSAHQFDQTITDANYRTQRQVARIDGMVTAALTTTSEIVETIHNGIRVPAEKIAGFATQLRYGLEGLMAKVKSGSPSGNGNG